MNTKTTLAFRTASIIALVLLFAFGPIVGDHQAFAYGWYDGHSGYYGHWAGYYGQPRYYCCYGQLVVVATSLILAVVKVDESHPFFIFLKLNT